MPLNLQYNNFWNEKISKPVSVSEVSKIPQAKYTLNQTFGQSDRIPDNCPTYVERPVHGMFRYSIEQRDKPVVVFGSARQGKTWLVERCCPSYIRVGCVKRTNVEWIFRAILDQLDIPTGVRYETSASEIEGNVKLLRAKRSDSKSIESESFNINNLDILCKIIKKAIGQRCIVLENFHYLTSDVQQEMAQILRHFIHYKIKIIIIGVWKDQTKLIRMVPDLNGRIDTIDISHWNNDELSEVATKGQRSLNIVFDNNEIKYFIKHCGKNISIFKTLLERFCMHNGVFETQRKTLNLSNLTMAQKVVEEVHTELFAPIIDRLDAFLKPQTKTVMGARYYTIRALLDILGEYETEEILTGIPRQAIIDRIHAYKETEMDNQHFLKQIIHLHIREGPELTYETHIPLFYYDTTTERVHITDSALICAASSPYINMRRVLGPKERYVRGI